MVYSRLRLSGLPRSPAEVIWTRLLCAVFGATVYTFSIILAVFLVGLGIGSSRRGGQRVATRRGRAWRSAGVSCSAVRRRGPGPRYLLTGLVCRAWSMPSVDHGSALVLFQLDFVRALWVVLPGGDSLGRQLPARAGVARAPRTGSGATRRRRLRREHGRRDRGALGASLVLVAWLGQPDAQQVLIVVAAISRRCSLLMPAAASRSPAPPCAGIACAIIAGPHAAALVPPVPGLLVAYGRYAATWVGPGRNHLVGRGRARIGGGVADAERRAQLSQRRKVQASSEPQDMRLQRMLGHLTTLIPKHARSVLVIGCGAGVTAGAVSSIPHVEQRDDRRDRAAGADVVSPVLRRAQLHDVVDNPKVHVIIDDARHYLLTTDEKFDAITSDPLDPWVKGAATLYTREFFEVGQGAPESRRRGDAVRAAVREHRAR